MSYILDALNKSEQERQQQQDLSGLHLAAGKPGKTTSGRWLLLIPAALVLVVVAVFAGYQFSTTTADKGAPAPTAVTTVATPAAQATARTAAGFAPDTVQPGVSAPSRPLTPAAGQPANTSDVPYLAELSWSFRSQVPDIDYGAHVYSENGGTGFVILNGTMRYEGYNLGAGLTVKKILPEGVVIEYRGQQFRLEAMKSWRQR